MSALVVGAGFAGLAAALGLRARGLEVTLLEREPEVGGKARAVRAAGARVDVGPTLLVDPQPLRALLALAGAQAGQAVTLHRLDPVARVTVAGAPEIRWAADPAAMASEIRRLGPDAGADWARFLDLGASAARLAARFVERGDIAGGRDLVRFVAGSGPALHDVAPFLRHASLAGLLAASVRTGALRRLLGHFARFVGLDAAGAPAVTVVIPYLMATTGAWYPDGGFAALARTLASLARAAGVQVRLGAAVERMQIGGDGITVLVDGEALSADTAVAAVDVATTARWLSPAVRIRGTDALRPALSAWVAWWVIEGRAGVRVHHALHFDGDGEPLYVATPSVTDGSLAPAGVEIVHAALHVPAGHARPDALAPALRERIEATGQWPPGPVLAEGVAGDGTTCYGYRIRPGLLGAFRPSQRLPGLPLALAGGSVFPGPGVANALRSGMRAAALAAVGAPA